jgi:hypothetical protein
MQALYTAFGQVKHSYVPTEFHFVRFIFGVICCGYLSILDLVGLQLDVQISFLFTYNIFIKILYVFRASLYSSPGGLRRTYIYAASGIVTLCR